MGTNVTWTTKMEEVMAKTALELAGPFGDGWRNKNGTLTRYPEGLSGQGYNNNGWSDEDNNEKKMFWDVIAKAVESDAPGIFPDAAKCAHHFAYIFDVYPTNKTVDFRLKVDAIERQNKQREIWKKLGFLSIRVEMELQDLYEANIAKKQGEKIRLQTLRSKMHQRGGSITSKNLMDEVIGSVTEDDE